MSVNGEVPFATFTLFHSFARFMRFRTRGGKEEKKRSLLTTLKGSLTGWQRQEKMEVNMMQR